VVSTTEEAPNAMLNEAASTFDAMSDVVLRASGPEGDDLEDEDWDELDEEELEDEELDEEEIEDWSDDDENGEED
jgi:hypothetical protein